MTNETAPTYPRHWSFDDQQGVPLGVIREVGPFDYEAYAGNGQWYKEPEAWRVTQEDARPLRATEIESTIQLVDQRRAQHARG